MATKNSINNKSQDITIDPGASGDSFVQFDINGTGEFRIGVDDDAGDAFKMSQGSALGTNDTFIMTAEGERTMPLQPAFLAIVATQIDNVTGDSTDYTIVFDTEVFDQNGDFDGTSTFTAPVTGRYELIVSQAVGGLVSTNTVGLNWIITSNRSYVGGQNNPYLNRDASNNWSTTFSVLADMDAADTATTTIGIGPTSKVVDIITGGATEPYTTFSGYLAC